VASVLLLRTHRHDDINVRSAFLHLAQDASASLAVLVAAQKYSLVANSVKSEIWVDPVIEIVS
jgi:cobalt-zinc-cadmium efflux system protein